MAAGAICRNGRMPCPRGAPAAALVSPRGRRGMGDPDLPAGAAVDLEGCATRVIHDWSEGRLTDAYPIPCYRRALNQLPADLLVYSSVPDDIEAALHDRVTAL